MYSSGAQWGRATGLAAASQKQRGHCRGLLQHRPDGPIAVQVFAVQVCSAGDALDKFRSPELPVTFDSRNFFSPELP